MKNLLIFVVFATAVCFPRSSGTKKAELKNVSQRKEFLTKAKKHIDELKKMFNKFVAVDKNNSMTDEEKIKAFSAIEKGNPMAFSAVYVFHMNVAGTKNPMVLPPSGAKAEEFKKEVRAEVAKLIDGLYAALKRRIDILDDKSKTSVEKLKSLAKLARENPQTNLVLQITVGAVAGEI
ncbi:unnamed protein product [Cylicocyclus nassatus]|uniref:Uncharacterized protein n=1 Tax=Cylicocyclus nassatus TaxID=53992 RepID=A0AA36M152_CYLNA|nr:unnamed protein product [Cylicocyclus nassatus]